MAEDAERIRRLVYRDGVCGRLMDTLTGGPFLAGLALFVGASNLVLGVLAALPILAQVAQLPTLGLLLRVHDRRKVVVVSCFVARALLLGIGLVLFAQPALLTGGVLLAVFTVSAIVAVTATAAWNWWMRDLLPPKTLGSFFGQRMRSNTIAAMVALLAAGWALDQFRARGDLSDGYAMLFALGALFGLVGLVFLARTPHPPPPPSPPARRSLSILVETLRQTETRRLSLAFAAVASSVTFALPFVAVYLLRSLGYSYVVVTALTALSQVAYILGLRGWAHLSDNHGNRAVLLLSIGLLAAVQVGWAAAGWHPGWSLLGWAALLHFLAGYATGGVDLGGTNLLLRSAPEHGAPAHLAAVSLGRALLAGLGTIAAGAIWDAVGPGPLATWGSYTLRGFQLLSLGGVALALAALLALQRVPEPSARPVLEVARAMRREVHQMSSVAGIRGLIHAVSYSVEFMAAPFAARRTRRLAHGGPSAPTAPAPPPPAPPPPAP